MSTVMLATRTVDNPATGNDFEDTRRITEDDPDYQRLHNATVARLQRSLRQYARALLQGEPGADTRFIHRHIGIIRQAYEAAHREGQRDYWPAVSNRVMRHRYIVPDQEQVQKRLAFYALGSVLKMAHEVKTYVRNNQQQALSETIFLYNPNHDAKGRFTYGSGATSTVAKGEGRTKRGEGGKRVKNENYKGEKGAARGRHEPPEGAMGSRIRGLNDPGDAIEAWHTFGGTRAKVYNVLRHEPIGSLERMARDERLPGRPPRSVQDVTTYRERLASNIADRTAQYIGGSDNA